jgi:rod shape-determining protein MreD
MRWVVEAVWLTVAAVAFGAYASDMAIGLAVPVLPVIVIVRAGLTGGELAGNLLGLLGGLLMDVFALESFGSGMLMGSLLGYSVGAVRSRIVLDSLSARVVTVVFASLAYSVGLALVRNYAHPVGLESVMVALGTGLYTALVGAAVWTAAFVAQGVFGWRSVWDAERR